MKHREFWIERGSFKWNCEENKEMLHGWKVGGIGPFHVIEYAAYEELEAENARLREALEDQGKLVRRLSEMFKEDGV